MCQLCATVRASKVYGGERTGIKTGVQNLITSGFIVRYRCSCRIFSKDYNYAVLSRPEKSEFPLHFPADEGPQQHYCLFFSHSSWNIFYMISKGFCCENN
jgi:hypothetical protein